MADLKESVLTNLRQTPQEWQMWNLLLGDAFGDLRKALKKKAQAPTAPVPPELKDVVEAFGAYAKCDFPALELAICRWNLYRPFLN